ncbi:putative quinone oxidoreductase/zeta-crystallin, GroES-like superfamily [Plasmopara halstedii]
MKSWFYTKHGSPSVMEMGTQPDPKLVDPKDVVVKVHAAALNPIDYKRRQGAMKLIIKDTWPQIVGYDFSGVVTSCGSDVTKFAEGDEVFGMLPHDRNGALAEFVAVSSDYISKKPSNLTHVEAATLPMAALTALQSFRHGQLGENKKVLILGGAGGVGSMAIQVAKAVFKPQTIATTASTQKVERMRLLGADVVVDYKHNRFETELKDYDFALDTTGEAKQCLECVTRGGSVITIVATPSRKSLPNNVQGVDVSLLIGLVMNCLSYSVCSQARRAEILYDFMFVLANGDMMNEVRELAEQRSITPVIDKVFPFEKANMAMEYLESGRALGKVVVQLVDTTKAM